MRGSRDERGRGVLFQLRLIWRLGFLGGIIRPREIRGYARQPAGLRKAHRGTGFGWIQGPTGGLAKTRHRGLERVGWKFTLSAAAYNLARLPRPLAAAST